MAIGNYVKRDSAMRRISRILNELEELPKEINYLMEWPKDEKSKETLQDRNQECEKLKETLQNKNQESERLRKKLKIKNQECEELRKKLAFYERLHSLKTIK